MAFILVLGLVLTGVFRPSPHRLSLGGARSPRSQGTRARDTGVSGRVGAIPGSGSDAGYGASASLPSTLAVAAKPLPSAARHVVPKLTKLLQADVLVVDTAGLSSAVTREVKKLHGVVAAVPVDAGRIKVNGVFVNVLGVHPAAFRPFAAKPTAKSTTLWKNIAAGGMAISYTMGTQDKMSLSKPVKVVGSRAMSLPVAGFGTVGIGGVDAVVSTSVAKTLGLPEDNAIIISAPDVRLDVLMEKIKKLVPPTAGVAALVTQIIAGHGSGTDSAGAAGEVMTLGTGTVAQGQGLSQEQLTRFLSAALSRVGMPYVWGGDGPDQFDCSGLVQWSLRQAGVVMPRVAADQARTGPLLSLSDLEPGDLLFYHTDPTAPDYISHVAIYIGNGKMLQAPEPGMNVQIVKADFGAGFAGAIAIYPKVAAEVAGSIAG
ncbi:MAG TPA: NlpC/P60 family protein [Streptosporangiaceae bacterium]|nr:NlpC/P60 family protein [Streptosporangiaceae bacterium]